MGDVICWILWGVWSILAGWGVYNYGVNTNRSFPWMVVWWLSLVFILPALLLGLVFAICGGMGSLMAPGSEKSQDAGPKEQ